MYEKSHTYVLDQSVSSLFSNLDVLVEDDEMNDGTSDRYQRFSFLTVSKSHVYIQHQYQDGKHLTLQVTKESKVKNYQVLQAKWCHLLNQIVIVITTYKSLLIFDGEGKLLLFWHNPENDDTEEVCFYRGIACVGRKYICVGSNSGGVLVITAEKNSFIIKETLQEHSAALCALSGLESKSPESDVDFVSADDKGTLCTFKSGGKFELVSRFEAQGENLPCTSVQLLTNGLVVVGLSNGHIQVFDVTTSTMLADVFAHVRAVSCLDMSTTTEDNSYTVISGSEDSFVRVWKISRDDTISISQEWYTIMKDLQVCGARFCDPKGQSFVVTGYDVRKITKFSKIY